MKEYCVQNNGDCSTCSLVNYGRDCINEPLEREDDEGEVMNESEKSMPA